jgi:hypothetical protein
VVEGVLTVGWLVKAKDAVKHPTMARRNPQHPALNVSTSQRSRTPSLNKNLRLKIAQMKSKFK